MVRRSPKHSTTASPRRRNSRQKRFLEKIFPFDVLEKSAARFSLDSLDEERAREERERLRNLFFSWEWTEIADTDLLRRHTLGLFFNPVSAYGKAGLKPHQTRSIIFLFTRPTITAYCGVMENLRFHTNPRQPLRIVTAFGSSFAPTGTSPRHSRALLYCSRDSEPSACWYGAGGRIFKTYGAEFPFDAHRLVWRGKPPREN